MPTVILLAPHEADQVKHPAGARLTLPEPEADWLIERGIAEAASNEPAPAKAKPAKAKPDDAH